MRVLVVAPLEGFVTGQAVVSCAAREAFRTQHSVKQVNTNFESQSSFSRLLNTLKAFFLVLCYCFLSDVVYYSFKRGRLSVLFDFFLLSTIRLVGRCRIIGHMHGNELFQSNSLGMAGRLFLKNLSKCDRVICLNSFQRSELNRLSSGVNLVVVPNFSEEQISAESLQKKMVRPGGSRPLKVLYLSNLLIEKGIVDYVSVAKQFDHGLEFVIAGKTLSSGCDGDIFVSDLLQVLPSNCKYLGPVYGEEKFNLLKSSDVLIFPSVYPTEAQPIVLIEAMAFGVVPISYDRPYLSDVFSKDDGCGFVIQEHDISSICGMLTDFMQDMGLLHHAMVACWSRAALFSKEAFDERILSAIVEANE